jgi:hypothetical protein
LVRSTRLPPVGRHVEQFSGLPILPRYCPANGRYRRYSELERHLIRPGWPPVESSVLRREKPLEPKSPPRADRTHGRAAEMRSTRAIVTVLLAAAAFLGSAAGVAAASTPTTAATSSTVQPDDIPWH